MAIYNDLSLMRKLYKLLLALLCSTGLSCAETSFFKKKDEGVIIYDVTFPFEENSLLMELYPREMVFEFKDEKYHTTLKSSYGVIATEFIIDNDKGEFIQMLKSFSDRTFIRIDKEAMPAWLAQYPSVNLEKTGQSDSLAGTFCMKTIAHLRNDSVPAIDLYFTTALDLENDGNWWNQFTGVEGFLMGYDVEQYGKRMRLRAREIRYGPVSNDRFEVPADYLEITPEEMREKIRGMMADFMN
jgi:hypothetical protein